MLLGSCCPISGPLEHTPPSTPGLRAPYLGTRLIFWDLPLCSQPRPPSFIFTDREQLAGTGGSYPTGCLPLPLPHPCPRVSRGQGNTHEGPVGSCSLAEKLKQDRNARMYFLVAVQKVSIWRDSQTRKNPAGLKKSRTFKQKC